MVRNKTNQIATNHSRVNRSQWYAKSTEDKNFNANANSANPRTTFTEFNHPPDCGKEFNHPGKIAKMVNGIAKAKENPVIPIAGVKYDPEVDASTNKVPMIGPVQEKETNPKVKAMKKMPM